MAEMAQIAPEWELIAKVNKEKVLSEGEMVLVHKPGLHSKMEDNWEGPYRLVLVYYL